jgi:hypothetical protein
MLSWPPTVRTFLATQPADLCHELILQQAATIREAPRRIEQLEHAVARLTATSISHSARAS